MPRSGPRLSLLEAALLLCLIGIVLAIFVPTFVRRVRTNKIDEASELLRELSARAAAYYATSWDGTTHCLPPAAGPTPAVPTVEAQSVDFSSPDAQGHDSWSALGFQPERPVRYSYTYTPSQDGCGLDGRERSGTVSFRAQGDLDGDEVQSTFERRATFGADGWQQADVLRIHQRIE